MSNAAKKTEEVKMSVKDVIDSTEQKAHETLEKARDKADDVVEKVHGMETEIGESVAEFSGAVRRYINEKPLQAAGIAFAAGVLATLLVRRR